MYRATLNRSSRCEASSRRLRFSHVCEQWLNTRMNQISPYKWWKKGLIQAWLMQQHVGKLLRVPYIGEPVPNLQILEIFTKRLLNGENWPKVNPNFFDQKPLQRFRKGASSIIFLSVSPPFPLPKQELYNRKIND